MDEELEILQCTAYCLVTRDESPVCLTNLPLHSNQSRPSESNDRVVFLRGRSESGEIRKQVVAWKFELPVSYPVIFLLSTNNNWIRLKVPSDNYIVIMRSTLVTLHFLHLAKHNPKASGTFLWKSLKRNFSLSREVPSEWDILEHEDIIHTALRVETDLERSKYLSKFLRKRRWEVALLEDARTSALMQSQNTVRESLEVRNQLRHKQLLIRAYSVYLKPSVLARIIPNNPMGLTDVPMKKLGLFQTIFRRLTYIRQVTKGNSTQRVDLETNNILQLLEIYDKDEVVVVGSIPGVAVGREFRFKVELAIVGLHRQLQKGIDYIEQGGIRIATSIVVSGGYEDDVCRTEEIIYSGAGGRSLKSLNILEDQTLTRENLALKNSISEQNPIRVIRRYCQKISNGSEKPRKVKPFIYDGLYLVTNYEKKRGQSGNLVYMFHLKRILNQPALDWNLLENFDKSKDCHGVCTLDISGGKEKTSICAINVLDDQTPPSFNYMTKMPYRDRCQLVPLGGCECIGDCSDSVSCLCAERNGGEIPYNKNGFIVKVKPVIYECDPSCKCPPSCSNRVGQLGIKFQLEIFKKETIGCIWGVRSLYSIPSGKFVCEYVGELKVANDVEFTINTERYGNISKLMNKSSSPNLRAQLVHYAHEVRRPHVLLFAAKDIEELEELTV